MAKYTDLHNANSTRIAPARQQSCTAKGDAGTDRDGTTAGVPKRPLANVTERAVHGSADDGAGSCGLGAGIRHHYWFLKCAVVYSHADLASVRGFALRCFSDQKFEVVKFTVFAWDENVK